LVNGLLGREPRTPTLAPQRKLSPVKGLQLGPVADADQREIRHALVQELH